MKKYAIGIDLGGTSVKYALIDNEGVFHFQGKLPSKADVSAEAVIGQLVTACKEVMASALQLGVAVEGIGIGTPGIVDETNRIVLGGAENIKGWENLNLAAVQIQFRFFLAHGENTIYMCLELVFALLRRSESCATEARSNAYDTALVYRQLTLPVYVLFFAVPTEINFYFATDGIAFRCNRS